MQGPGTNDSVRPIRVIHANFDDALTRDFEAWRRRQPRIPTTAEAVRRLIARALANEEHVRA
jgi:hypothetical protein